MHVHEDVHVHEGSGGHSHEDGYVHVHEDVHEDGGSSGHGGGGISSARVVQVGQAILRKNDQLADRNRAFFLGRRVAAFNLVSSPGAGKTTLLERTIRALGSEVPLAVLEGDQATDRDAERIRAAGARAVQINTGAGCHLDADMVWSHLEALDLAMGSLLLIENVGNLVCPALFDLGERAKVVVCSVTEGDDKPIKYPHMFRASRLMVLNKVDLLPYVDFDVARCIEHARSVNPEIEVLEVSAKDGTGLDAWLDWIRSHS
ncbi:MAG: hydrogenase nickel incorporation protein HypB [Sandaracinaceae bacterium]